MACVCKEVVTSKMKSCHWPTSEFGRIVELVGIEICDCLGCLASLKLRRRTDDVKAKLKLAHASCHANLHRFLFFFDQGLEPKFVPNITALFMCSRRDSMCL